MLAVVGLLTILCVLAAILSKRVSPFVALAVIPLAAAILLGEALSVGGFMLDGLIAVGPTAAMFLFAILFFSILSQAGLFNPIVNGIVRVAGNHPPSVTLGTAVIGSLVHLDGSGATTFIIVIPALIPVYDRLGIDRKVLACIVAMAAGVGNMLPWGGPTLRAASALDEPVTALFAPLAPVYGVGLVSMLALSWFIGMRSMRAPAAAMASGSGGPSPRPDEPEKSTPVDLRYLINFLTVVAVIALLLGGWLPPAVAFLLGTVVALVVNLPTPSQQHEAIERHAPAAVMMVAILLAAGSFTGIMRGTGMLDALAHGGAGLLPDGGANWIAPVIAVLSMPLSLLFDPDSFYFGVLPVLSGIAEQGGQPGVEVAHAAILGQMTTGFPISPMTPATFLLVGLCKIDLADHQRFAFPFLYLLTLVMALAAMLFGVVQL